MKKRKRAGSPTTNPISSPGTSASVPSSIPKGTTQSAFRGSDRFRIVERLGKYHKTLTPGLNVLVPFIDRRRPLIDMREQVVSFPPQPVITEDNLVVSIDTVVYFQVTDARAATYEIRNYLGAVE